MSRPFVSVLMPVLDEERHIVATLEDLLAQDYDGPWELVVADGMSGDGTRSLVAGVKARDERVRLVDNPERRQAHGLNAAAAAASGEILVRADGHSRYARDYISASVAALEELGGAVGGRMSPAGDDSFTQAVAAAMVSPFAIGPARFHHAQGREMVDTVYLGAFYRADFEAVGGMRSFPSGSSEDADFYYRWRRSGRAIHVDPAIRSSYTPRDRLDRLWRQYWRYGQGKSEMLWVNGRFPSLRPLAPLALVLALMVGVGVAIAGGPIWPVLTVVGAWLAVLLAASVPSGRMVLLVMLVAGTMHLAYGFGSLWGLVRGPFPVRALR
jgi:glycosyltransferase involved in cell wall biosynthesis